MNQHGPCIYFDTSSKGGEKGKPHNTWRADITIDGIRYRKRHKDKSVLYSWLKNLGK